MWRHGVFLFFWFARFPESRGDRNSCPNNNPTLVDKFRASSLWSTWTALCIHFCDDLSSLHFIGRPASPFWLDCIRCGGWLNYKKNMLIAKLIYRSHHAYSFEIRTGTCCCWLGGGAKSSSSSSASPDIFRNESAIWASSSAIGWVVLALVSSFIASNMYCLVASSSPKVSILNWNRKNVLEYVSILKCVRVCVRVCVHSE